ncbi:MAG TPA: SIR2 family protein [Steroidobacteraceae bacterium]
MTLGTTEIDPRLLEDIRAGNCVAFVGAGFSAAAGLPAWPELVRAIARALPPEEAAIHRATLDQLLGTPETQGSHRELEMAAQLLFDALGEERCRHLLRDTLRPDRLPPVMQQRLKHLLGIPFRAIVTTNFDPLLPGVPPDAMAYRRLLRSDRFGAWREATLRAALGLDFSLANIDAPDRPVVQLHGTLLDDSTLVFTRSQYRRRLYANPAYLTALKALLATSSVLFLGYSMRDAYLNELRAELIEAFQTSAAATAGTDDAARIAQLRRPLAWAVLEDVSDVARAYYERHEGLGVLPYRTGSGRADHSGFDAILARIYGQTNPVHRLGQLLRDRRLLWLDPSPEHNALGRRLITAAVREVEGTSEVVHHLVEVATCQEAVALLQQRPGFDMVLTHWGHGAGPGGLSNGEALLRATAGLRAQGQPMPPVMVFAGAGHEAENRRRALQLGAIGFTSNWSRLMAVIERVLADV